MEFVKVYPEGTHDVEVAKDIGHFDNCGAVEITMAHIGSRYRLSLEVSNVHDFLGCVHKYVDEHTLDAWTAQASLHGNMRTYTGRNRPGGHGAPDFKAGKNVYVSQGEWRDKLSEIYVDEREGIKEYESLQKIAPTQLGEDIQKILKDEKKHVQILDGYFR